MTDVVHVKHHQPFQVFLTKLADQQLPSERDYTRDATSQVAFLRQMGLLCLSSIKMAETAFKQGETKGYQEVFEPAKQWLIHCKPNDRIKLISNLSYFNTHGLLATCNRMHLEEDLAENDIALIKKGIALKQHLLDWHHWLKLVASLRKETSYFNPLSLIMETSTPPAKRIRCCIDLLKQGPGIVIHQAELCLKNRNFHMLALIIDSFCDYTMLQFLDIYCASTPKCNYLLEQLSYCRDQLKAIERPVLASPQPIYAQWSSPYPLQDEGHPMATSEDHNKVIITLILAHMTTFKTRSLPPTPSKLQAPRTSTGKFSRFNAIKGSPTAQPPLHSTLSPKNSNY